MASGRFRVLFLPFPCPHARQMAACALSTAERLPSPPLAPLSALHIRIQRISGLPYSAPAGMSPASGPALPPATFCHLLPPPATSCNFTTGTGTDASQGIFTAGTASRHSFRHPTGIPPSFLLPGAIRIKIHKQREGEKRVPGTGNAETQPDICRNRKPAPRHNLFRNVCRHRPEKPSFR